MIFKTIWIKITSIFLRFWHIVKFFPNRFMRLINHFGYGFKQLSKKPTSKGYLFWLTELGMLMLDLLGIGEWYELFQEFFKFNTRPLNKQELQITEVYFGNQLNINRIRIDECALLGPKQHRFAYVSFFTINSWKNLRPDIFLHEMVHIWQYQQKGITYMSRALGAQRGKRGYNYGGVEMLRKLKERGWKLESFNPEHQAEIVQDHFRIKNGYAPLWGEGCFEDLEVYDWFVDSLSADN